jgi:hypothetical protein
MRLLLCFLAFLGLFEAFELPQSPHGPDMQVDKYCSEKQSPNSQQLVLDALDIAKDPTRCNRVCPMQDRIRNKRKLMKHIWKKGYVSPWLSIWLKAVKYHDWPRTIAKYIWDLEAPNIDCGSMGGSRCGPLTQNCCKSLKAIAAIAKAYNTNEYSGDLCYEGTKQAPGYFFYRAAEIYHSMTGRLHEKLQDQVLSINVDEIVSAWDGASDTDDQVDAVSIFAGVLGVAGSAVGAVPGGGAPAAALGTLAGIFSTAQAAVGDGGEGGNPTKQLKHLVQDYFKTNNKLLSRNLKDVFGGRNGDPGRIPIHGKAANDDVSEEDGDGDKRGHWHIGKVMKFFSHGKWLFSDIDPHAHRFAHRARKTLVSC